MTIPWLMNCSHRESGWCDDCIKEFGEEYQQLQEDYYKLKEELQTYKEYVGDNIFRSDYRNLDEFRQNYDCVCKENKELLKQYDKLAHNYIMLGQKYSNIVTKIDILYNRVVK